MTDCCVTPPSIGTWKIYVRMPIYYPSRVKFNWNDSSTGQQIVNGDNYIISQEFYSDSNNLYNVVIKKEVWRRQNDHSFWYFAYSFNETYYNLRGKIIGLGSYDPNNWNSLYGILYNNGNSLHSVCLNYELIDSTYPYNVSAFRIFMIDIIRTDGIIEKQYSLKIFDNGAKIYDQTKNTQPTAEIMPPQCIQNEQKTFVREYQNHKSNDYCYQQISGNQARLFLYSEQLNGSFLPLLLAYSASDERCSLAPIYEVECVPCRICPEGSCEIICGDQVCCYNAETGIMVDSFLVSEMC